MPTEVSQYSVRQGRGLQSDETREDWPCQREITCDIALRAWYYHSLVPRPVIQKSRGKPGNEAMSIMYHTSNH